MSGLHLHYIYNWLKFGYLLKFDGKCLRKINSIPKTHFTFAPNNMQADEFWNLRKNDIIDGSISASMKWSKEFGVTDSLWRNYIQNGQVYISKPPKVSIYLKYTITKLIRHHKLLQKWISLVIKSEKIETYILHIICRWRSAACWANSTTMASSKNLLMLTSSLIPCRYNHHQQITPGVF